MPITGATSLWLFVRSEFYASFLLNFKLISSLAIVHNLFHYNVWLCKRRGINPHICAPIAINSKIRANSRVREKVIRISYIMCKFVLSIFIVSPPTATPGLLLLRTLHYTLNLSDYLPASRSRSSHDHTDATAIVDT